SAPSCGAPGPADAGSSHPRAASARSLHRADCIGPAGSPREVAGPSGRRPDRAPPSDRSEGNPPMARSPAASPADLVTLPASGPDRAASLPPELARRLRDQYAEIAQLAGGLAHEIRNPLSTMRLTLDLLVEDFQDP